MKIIKNNIIPFKGFEALTLWPFIFVRKDCDDSLTPTTLNHEKIHGALLKEMLLVFFYMWYGIEYLARLLQYRSSKTAYKNISFEREAYANQDNASYVEDRRPYSFLHFIRNKNNVDVISNVHED